MSIDPECGGSLSSWFQAPLVTAFAIEERTRLSGQRPCARELLCAFHDDLELALEESRLVHSGSGGVVGGGGASRGVVREGGLRDRA